MLTENEEDKEEWKKEFSKLLQKEALEGRCLYFRPDTPETIEKLKSHMRKSDLFILPLKSDSPLFGMEVLSAVAAGVPILVSNNSGIASLLMAFCQDASVIKETTRQPDAVTWKEGIIQKLVGQEEAQRDANLLRKQLLLNTGVTEAHLEFVITIVGNA